MGDDIGSGSICFDFCRSAAECVVYDRQQPVTEPEPMSSSISYPAYSQ